MKRYHIVVEQVLDAWFSAEDEDEAVEKAERAFEWVPVEIFIDEEMEDE